MIMLVNNKKITKEVIDYTKYVLAEFRKNKDCVADCVMCGLSSFNGLDNKSNCTCIAELEVRLMDFLGQYDPEIKQTEEQYERFEKLIGKICTTDEFNGRRFEIVGYAKDKSNRLIVVTENGWDIIDNRLDFVSPPYTDLKYMYINAKYIKICKSLRYIITNPDRNMFINVKGTKTSVYDKDSCESLMFDTFNEACKVCAFEAPFSVVEVDSFSFYEWCDLTIKLKEKTMQTFYPTEFKYIVIGTDGKYLVDKNGRVAPIGDYLTQPITNFVFTKPKAQRLQKYNGGVVKLVNTKEIEELLEKQNKNLEEFKYLINA